MANFTSTHTGAVIDAAVTKITATSSSATELNLLDGVTSTTAEINILDGVTSTAAEINILDGVTATTAEINLLDGLTATTTELNLIDGVTATTAEINYIDGVTSNIQTQLNLKAPLAGAILTGTTSFQNLSDGTITITAFADEDDFSSNSATLLATQQSIKAYVDANVNTELIQDLVGAMFTSNTESGITVAYEDSDGTIDLTVATQSDNNFTTTLKNKLDAIEASATADQSNAEIRTAVEAATDSNVFTDSDHSKLNAIEASADVTDTANVTSAGALMDSELTSIANVKALDQSVVSGATPTFTTTNFTDASNKRLMTDAQETKLDSVESSADVTDTANVTSAGALMDSELTDLAGVKGVTISTLQPKPSEGAFANGDKTKLDAIEAGATADQTDEEIQDIVGAMFTSTNTETGITATYQDATGDIDLVVGTLNQDTTGNAATATKIASITNSDIVQLTDTQTLTNKTLTSPVLNTGVSGSAILDEDNMASNSATKLSSQQSIKAYVDAEVAGVVDSSPAALNTLNELAAALGDDANFSTTTSTSLGNRLRVDTASQGLTGTQQANAITNLGITATKAELNILDGVTATATELNLIDGVTATTAELNILDGVTSTAAELNILDGVTATAAELNIMDGVTATTAELNYTDGVTSNIQTQLDATLDTAGTGIDISSTTVSVDVSDFMAGGSANRVLTSTGSDAFQGEGNLNFDGTDLTIAHSSGAIKFAAAHATDKIQLYNGGNEKIGTSANTIIFTGDNHKFIDTASSETMQWTSSNNYLTIHETGASKGSHLRLATDNSDFIFSASGASNQLSIYDVNATANSLVLDSNGKITLRDSLKIPVGKSVFFGASEHTYIREDIDDRLRFFVGGAEMFRLNEINDFASFFTDVALGATDKLYLDGGSNTYIDEPSGDQLRLVAGGTEVLKGYSGGAIDMYGGSINRSINIGANRTADAASFIDLVGDTTYTDYGARLIRNSGANAITDLTHRGTGALRLRCQDAGAVLFMISDAEKMRVASSGNVGIGTTSPAGKLEIKHTSATISDPHIAFEGSGGETDDFSIYAPSGENTLRFGYSGSGEDTDILTIQRDSATSGSVGIGTNSPSYLLHLSGTAPELAFTDTDGTKTWRARAVTNNFHITETGAGDPFVIQSGAGANALLINSSGNVGIGTNSPGEKLEVNGSIALSNNTYFKARNSAGTLVPLFRLNSSNHIEIINGNSTNGDIIFKDASDTNMTIKGDTGNVGIGTGSPNHLLEIESQTNDVEVVQISNDAGGGGSVAGITHLGITHFPGNTYSSTRITAIENGTASYTGHLAFSTRSTNSDSAPAERMRISSAGNVGIGTTSPGEKLDLRGGNFRVGGFNGGSDYGAIFTPADSASYWHIYNDAGGHLAFGRSATIGSSEKMRIDSSGNVGIGTTSPDSKLEVSGSGVTAVKITGSYPILHFEDADTGAYIANNADGLFIGKTNSPSSSNDIMKLDLTNSRVGIGTGSPGALLDVGGRIHLQSDGVLKWGASANAGNLTWDTGVAIVGSQSGIDLDLRAAGGKNILFKVSSSEKMRIDSSGNVGIGTGSPGAKLVIDGGGDADADAGDASEYSLLINQDNNDKGIAFGFNGADDKIGAAIIAKGSGYNSNNKTDLQFYVKGSTGTTAPSLALTIDAQRNLRFADNGTNPSAVANTAFMFNDGGELKVLDELGTTTTISPHNFELIPEGASEDMAWSHHSVKGNKKVNVDMMRLARLVEELTGEKLVYTDEQ